MREDETEMLNDGENMTRQRKVKLLQRTSEN